MASSHGITAEILSGGIPLPCYDDPDRATNRKCGEVTKYIEAITNAKFEVAFQLTKDFHIRYCDGIKATYILDGHRMCFIYLGQRDFAHYTSDKAVVGTSQEFCATYRVWRRVEWSFGKLHIQEAMDAGTSAEKLKHLGSITLRIQRVNVRKRPVPVRYAATSHVGIENVPEKLLKGQAISNSVSLVKGPVIPPPEAHAWEYLPMSGSAGEPMLFTFLYRSKHALQILGCIPREPSPDVSFNLPSDDAAPKSDPTIDPSERDRKISALKAQLALLERSTNTNIKSDSKPPRSATSDTPTRLTGLKREHDGVEVVSARKRNRPPGFIETVDLTDD